jgi:transcriptional regulator with XRE-family HTH domain
MDSKLAADLGTVARAARTRAGLTQADVAERVGVASEVYGRLERGHMLPSVVTLRKLCLTLNVTADELLALRAPGHRASEQTETYGEPPEVRLLMRRLKHLDHKRLRLVSLIADAFGRR